MKITTRAVWSALEEVQRADARWQLYKHQGRMLDLLSEPQVDVVINQAMTGDGKSLAAQLHTLIHRSPLLVMYPTNELIRDQQKQIERIQREWNTLLRVDQIYGNRLDELIRLTHEHATKAEAIKRLASNNEVILTNPDIFHYIAQFYYTRRDDTPDLLFGRVLVDDFDIYVFDEFHIFQSPQVVSILNALLLIRAVAGARFRKKFLFLSATPNVLLADYLTRANLRVATVNGEYAHTSTPIEPKVWRCILQPSEIVFYSDSIEAWIDAHLEDTLLAFFHKHRSAAKGALIVNSVAAAYRLSAHVSPYLQAAGLRVALNTGLTGEEVKSLSYEADLLIGTSTVDVGVDFRINFLVFESRDSGTFLQRLGRLGRHDDDGRGHRFEMFEAHALVPKFVAERLFIGKDVEQPPLADGAQYTREQLRDAIISAYPSPTGFKSYAREWGSMQSASVYYKLGHPTVRDVYARTREQLKEDYRAVFGIHILREMQRLRQLNDDRQSKLVDEARAFRGTSPFACGLIDQTEQGAQRVKDNDLLRLAPNFEMKFLPFEQFEQEAQHAGITRLPPRYKDYVAHFRLYGPTAERRSMTIRLNANVGSWSAGEFGEAAVIDRIELDVEGAPWLADVNDRLRRRELVALLCLCQPRDLQYRLRLPPLFQLYPFVARDGLSGTIAFARDALLLQVAIKEKRFECGGGSVII